MLSLFASLIVALIDLYSLLVLVYVILSWVPRGQFVWIESLREVLAGLCEPLFVAIHRWLPASLGPFDFTPVIAILLLNVLAVVITAIL